MPHLPDHVTHDPELIAAYAAGDATGPALDLAADLVASCTECAELHRDLRAISTALPELPAPIRPHDFRLTREQADSLRPAGWRGVLAAFAAPRFRLAAPLGAGLAAAGLAGLLLASPGSLLQPASSGSAPSAAEAPVQADQPSAAAGAAGGNAGGAALAAPAAPSPAATSAPAAGGMQPDGAAIRPVPAAGGVAAPSAAASSAPEFAADQLAASPQRDLAATAASGPPDATHAGDTFVRAPSVVPAPVAAQVDAQVDASPPSDSTPWLVVSGLLVLVGAALVVLRMASRRVG